MPARVHSFDNNAFFSALDQHRRGRKMTWKQVADEAGVSASTLTRMSQGKRPDVDSLAALTAWSGLKTEMFVRDGGTSDDASSPDTVAFVQAYLRSDPNLTPASADALADILRAAYGRFAEK